MTYNEKLKELVCSDEYIMKALKAVKQMELENWDII